jgi:DNA-binding transcriptional MocR family regulator
MTPRWPARCFSSWPTNTAVRSPAAAWGRAAACRPSVRVLMARHHVSLNTALQACRSTGSEGLLEARPRLGYFVQRGRARSLRQPASRA